MSTINPINGPGVLTPPGTTLNPTGQNTPVTGSFGNILSGMVQDVNSLQATAGELRNQLIAGEGGDLHQVMIASEEAGVAMELLVEVRNKLVEAYQQLMRMPV
jgi:flagellar hook-basal body complex protein FliE